MRRRVDSAMENEEDTLHLASPRGYNDYNRPSIHTVPILIAFGLVAVLLGLFGLVYTIDGNLPKPLMVADEKTHPNSFITERARHYLKLLTEIGPRVVGSFENEGLTLDLIKNEISQIMRKAHKRQTLELDVQVVSGVHYLGYAPDGKIVPYANLQNIVVKLHGRSNTSQSVLINAHFDSVPTSPGGTDDGINVAVMLEILNILSRKSDRFLNHLIFLFNGAEETGLQAAHGFITKHKWAQDCKVVLNLEGAGAGGKMVLFQSGPSAPWLLKYYIRVPHPYGQAAGEEIFQSNLVPSDTDFRIFRDYGGLVGLDMAFFKYGYRYHTKYDDFEHIPLGSFQHAGDNTLSLIRSLGNAVEVSNPKANQARAVFYDFLGYFMITYTETTGCVVNIIVGLFSLVIFGLSIHGFKLGFNMQTLKYLTVIHVGIIGGWIISILFIASIAFIIDKSGFTMSWYANPCLIFGLYVIPTVGLSSTLLPLIKQKNLDYNIKAQLQAHSARFIWTMILLGGTILKIRAMYAIMLPVLFNSLGFALILIFKWQHTIRKWQIMYMISLAIPTIFLMYTALITFSLFIPITGRIGSDKNPELIIGFISLFFTIIITSPFVTLVTLVRHYKYLMIFFAIIFIGSLIIIFTPLGFPYTGNPDSPAPQRYWILHTRRVFHAEDGTETKRDSGYFMLNMDRNSPYILKGKVRDLQKAKSVREDCQRHLLCGLPLVHSKMMQIIEFSTWIPAGQPILPEPTKLDLISKTIISPNIIRYNVSITGPDRISVYFAPKTGIEVLNISLINKLPAETSQWGGRDLYFIVHISGKEAAPLAFTFDVRVPNATTETTTEIAISGIFVHDEKNKKVPDFAQFLNEFPDWADVTPWLGSYESLWI